MKLYSENILIYAITQTERKAATFFSEEWEKRTNVKPQSANHPDDADIVFSENEQIENKDTYIIKETEKGLSISAKTVRGLIFGYSLFLRKTTFKNNEIRLIENISGIHTPHKIIRGHQIGYRSTPNTYDAWDYAAYERYQLDMMAFGANTIEHNGSRGSGEFRNKLMKYEQEEFLAEASRIADSMDMNVSLWQANEDDETEENALDSRNKLYALMTRLDYLFKPGGDP